MQTGEHQLPAETEYVIVMRLMTFRTFWINASLSVAAVAVFLGALEFGARMLGAKPIYGGSTSIFVEDRELLWRLRRNCNVVWRGHRAGINSMGLRSPEVDYAASPGSKILVIGDSVTYGDGVATNETYARRLEKRLEGTAVINAGIPGYGTIQAFGLLERIGDQIAPDLVIYGYCLNDSHDDLLLMRHHGAKHVEKRLLKVLPATAPAVLFRSAFWSWLHGRLYSPHADDSPLGSLGPWGRVRHAEGRVPRLRDVWAPQKRHPHAQKAWELVRRSLTAFSKWAESHQARFAVICFPFVVQFDHFDDELESRILKPSQASDSIRLRIPAPLPQKGLSHLCTELRIPFLDLFPIFSAEGYAKQFVDKNHLSPAGHETAAFAIRAFLLERQLLNGS